MLQRAASNAYSWWWASHVHTKHSKWLQQNLNDVEGKVQRVLAEIEEDGDSFARRAEMYYKKRPELISFVHDFYRAYRSLAQRFDHLSTDLHTTSATLASLLPSHHHLPFLASDEDDDIAPPPSSTPQEPSVPKSGLGRTEAVARIESLRKGILEMQTEKEFIKVCYERGVEKYAQIDAMIVDTQKEVCGLQEEFDDREVINDDEARTVMADAALRSCRDSISRLRQEERELLEEARAEVENIKAMSPHSNNNIIITQDEEKVLVEAEAKTGMELTVTEMAGRVDELVSKVASLETEVSLLRSMVRKVQLDGRELMEMKGKNCDDVGKKLDVIIDMNRKINAQKNSLRVWFSDAISILDHLERRSPLLIPDIDPSAIETEQDSIQHLLSLSFEEDDDSVITATGLTSMATEVREAITETTGGLVAEATAETTEEKAGGATETIAKVTTRETETTGAEKIGAAIDTSGAEAAGSTTETTGEEAGRGPTETTGGKSAGEPTETTLPETIRATIKTTTTETPTEIEAGSAGETAKKTRESGHDIKRSSSFSFSCGGEDSQENNIGKGGQKEPNWRDLFTRGMEGREKVLLEEYTSVLRSLKEVKSILGETAEKLEEMRRDNRRKEEEVQSLLQQVKSLQHREKGGEEGGEEDVEDKKGVGAAAVASETEERMRGRIDEVLEQNLEFWLRFSAAFCQIQRFQREVEEVQEEAAAGGTYTLLGGMGAEMGAWVEQGAGLREELRQRQESLGEIEGEIKAAVGEEDREGRRFTAYEGAKLQGEVMNMKQENNKVGEELEAGMDHVTGLRQEVERTMTGVEETLGLGSRKIQNHTGSRSRVPLRSFIFGGRFRRQRPSSSAINPIFLFGLHRKRTITTPPLHTTD